MPVLLAGLTLSWAGSAQALAQITLQNKLNVQLNLYIDGEFGCGPVLPNGFCTSSVAAGTHTLDARTGGDPATIVATQPDVNIEDGSSPTWTVYYDTPPSQ